MIWNFDPQIFSFLPLRWYGLLFVGGFAIGVYIFTWLLRQQKNPYYEEITGKFFFYAILGTALGARLGHVFFYQWDYYSKHLLEIFMIWEGGLASHGGVAGMIIVTLIFTRKYGKKYKMTAWQFFDWLIIPALLVSSFIRLGNFCNSEILGVQTQSDKGIVFCGNIYNIIHKMDKSLDRPDVKVIRTGEGDNGLLPLRCELEFDAPNERTANFILANLKYSSNNFQFPDDSRIVTEVKDGKYIYSASGMGVLRYPAQLYESIAYLILFIIAMLTFRRLYKYPGLCFSIFLGAIFLFRFFIEYIKIEQVEREKGMILNIGQQLSIPVVLLCIVFAVWRYVRVKN